jgi:hypothetical protein
MGVDGILPHPFWCFLVLWLLVAGLAHVTTLGLSCDAAV